MADIAPRAIEVRLVWQSDHASHVERLLVPCQALQADGRWLAVTSSDTWAPIDATPWCQPANLAEIELPSAGLALPMAPRPGRFYPARLFGRALGSPGDQRPVRVLATTEDSLRIDPGHPLAGIDAALSFAPANEFAVPGMRVAELFEGPGMQRATADAEDGYFPPHALKRIDESTDTGFYAQARLVQHLDARCREALAELHGRLLPPKARVLDLMASHDSHLPPHLELACSGLGLNAQELAANPRLSSHKIQDLNAQPIIPWADAEFDAVICIASIEYLVHPLQLLTDVRRALKPRGVFVVSFSDRWFPTKAIAIWSELHAFERLGWVLHLLRSTGFADLHTETRRGLLRPPDDKHAAGRAFSDPLFSAWGYAP